MASLASTNPAKSPLVRKLLTAALALPLLAATVAATPAQAQRGGYGGPGGGYGGYHGGYGGYRGGYGYGYRGYGYRPGFAVGAAVLGLGIGAALAAPYYYAPPPVVYAPPPAYYPAPGYAYAPGYAPYYGQ